MRRLTLLSFLAGALLACLLFLHKKPQPTSTPVAEQHAPAPAKTMLPMPKPDPGVAEAADRSVVPAAPVPAQPVLPTRIRRAPVRAMVAKNIAPQQTFMPATPQPMTPPPPILMEFDPATRTLRPCLDTSAPKNVAAVPTPPRLNAQSPTPEISFTTVAPPPPAAAAKPKTLVLEAGSVITVRLAESISTKHNSRGDNFFAIVDEPVTADGVVIAPAGAQAEGRVIEAGRPGPLRGLARLSVVLTAIRMSNGQRLALNTLPFEKGGKNIPVLQQARVTASALVGGSVGLFAGEDAGSEVGGVVKNVIGTTGALVTGGKAAKLHADRPISFRLLEPVTIAL